MQRRLTADGSNVRAVSAYPGMARTNLISQARGFAPTMNRLVVRLFAQDSYLGALTTLHAATQDVPGNTLMVPMDSPTSADTPSSSNRPRRPKIRRRLSVRGPIGASHRQRRRRTKHCVAVRCRDRLRNLAGSEPSRRAAFSRKLPPVRKSGVTCSTYRSLLPLPRPSRAP